MPLTFRSCIVTAGSIQMDPSKVKAVMDWPIFLRRSCSASWGKPELQFCGTPLQSSHFPKYSHSAEEAFSELKRCFSSHPYLSQPEWALFFNWLKSQLRSSLPPASSEQSPGASNIR